ncbi:MAG TPA: HEAT repeat domain-containing protein [Aggregatilineales bacterium]|nr:HEAT repeat domain-containing protein [Aggregatilineales bacterium]
MNTGFQQLISNLDHPDATVRVAALDAIGQWDATHDGTDTRAAVAPVGEVLRRDPDADARWAAAYALGALGYAEGAPALLAALDEAESGGDGGLRLVIVKALGKTGSAEALPALEALAHSDSPCLRAAAQRALARLAPVG